MSDNVQAVFPRYFIALTAYLVSEHTLPNMIDLSKFMDADELADFAKHAIASADQEMNLSAYMAKLPKLSSVIVKCHMGLLFNNLLRMSSGEVHVPGTAPKVASEPQMHTHEHEVVALCAERDALMKHVKLLEHRVDLMRDVLSGEMDIPE